MKGAKAIWLCAVLAAVSVVGIIGMLLAHGACDWAYFALATVPVVVCSVSMRR